MLDDDNEQGEVLPDEGYFLVEPTDQAFARLRRAKWLTINGEFFTLLEWHEPDDNEPYYLRLHIKKIDGMPEDRNGFVGSFFLRGDLLRGPEGDDPEPPQ
jgi:hypothetical protein